MRLRSLAARLPRLLSILVGLSLVGYASRQSAVAVAAVLGTMILLAQLTSRRKPRSRRDPSTHIVIVALLTLLVWGGIAMAFKVADSLDPESAAATFAGEITISSLALAAILSVCGFSLAWYAWASETRSRRKRRRSGGDSATADKKGDATNP